MNPNHKSALEAVRRYVELRGGRVWVLAQAARLRGSAGLPDLFCVWRDKAFWVEVKAEGDKLRPAQQDFITSAGACGLATIVGGPDDVEAAFKQWDNEKDASNDHQR